MVGLRFKNRLGLYLSTFFAVRNIRVKLVLILSFLFLVTVVFVSFMPKNILTITTTVIITLLYVFEQLLQQYYDCWEFSIIHPVTNEEQKLKVMLEKRLSSKQLYRHKTGDF